MLFWRIQLVLGIFTYRIQGGCPSNGEEFNNICFWSINDNHDFEVSNDICNRNGGHLVAISSAEIFNFLLSKRKRWGMLYSSVWIGVHDKYQKRVYVNMLNETQTYLHWKTGEPNTEPGRHCVVMEHDSSYWATYHCHDKRQAICSLQGNASAQTSSVFYSQTTTIATSADQTHSTSTPTSGAPTSEAIQSQRATTSQFENCKCPCRTYLQENTEELKRKLAFLKAKLKINKAELSSSIRRRTSVSDTRTTATAIGSTLGLGLIVTFILCIVISDISILLNQFKLYWI